MGFCPKCNNLITIVPNQSVCASISGFYNCAAICKCYLMGDENAPSYTPKKKDSIQPNFRLLQLLKKVKGN